MKLHHLLTAVAIASLAACKQADNTFSRLPAHFTMENIYQAPVLYTACNSMGEFCTITAGNKSFIFTSLKTSNTVNQTALTGYSGFYLGLSGLIVGLPQIPEMGKDVSQVVCFDLACSNCYHEYGITKRLVMQEAGYALCSSCGRRYDLNDLGRTDDGRPLYRYRVSLMGNTLVIANN